MALPIYYVIDKHFCSFGARRSVISHEATLITDLSHSPIPKVLQLSIQLSAEQTNVCVCVYVRLYLEQEHKQQDVASRCMVDSSRTTTFNVCSSTVVQHNVPYLCTQRKTRKEKLVLCFLLLSLVMFGNLLNPV